MLQDNREIVIKANYTYGNKQENIKREMEIYGVIKMLIPFFPRFLQSTGCRKQENVYARKKQPLSDRSQIESVYA